jgi:hypothetical protein
VSAPQWWDATAKVHVLVEDELTEALLSGTWRDVDIRVDAVGGGETVSAMVNNARQRGALNVFGIVDLDFNIRPGWFSKGTLFRLPRHEAENYLFDFNALDALARTASGDVEREATSFANQCTAYMAARHALSKIDRELTANFPPAPRAPEQPFTLVDAIAHVNDPKFLGGLRTSIKVSWTEAAITALVTDSETLYAREVGSGKWVETFSGKEIVRHLRGRFTRLAGKGATPAQSDIDLAMRVTTFWQKRGAIPTDLSTLRTDLRQRAGL